MNLKVKCDKTLCHEVNEEGQVKKKEVPLVEGIMKHKDSSPTLYNVEFDGSLYICRADLESWREKHKFLKEKQKPEDLTPPAL